MVAALYPALDLARFAQTYGATFRRIEQAHCDHSIGAGEWRLLFGLSDRPLILSELARSLGMNSGQATRAMKKLIDQGLVVRHASGKGRAMLRLSDKGRVAVGDCESERVREARVVYEQMTEPERKRLLLAAQSLAQNLGDMRFDVEISAGEVSDTGLLLALTIDALSDAYPGLKAEQVARELLGRIAKLIGQEFVVAKLRDEFASGAFVQYFEETKVADIAFLCVASDYRGIGIGKTLLQYCCERAQAKGMQQIQVALPAIDGKSLAKLNPAWQRGQRATDGRWGQHITTDRWWQQL